MRTVKCWVSKDRREFEVEAELKPWADNRDEVVFPEWLFEDDGSFTLLGLGAKPNTGDLSVN